MTDLWMGLDDIDDWIDVCPECGNGPLTGEDLQRGLCECCNYGHEFGRYNQKQCWRCLTVMAEDEEDDGWEDG